jgi:hypothetical protein
MVERKGAQLKSGRMLAVMPIPEGAGSGLA